MMSQVQKALAASLLVLGLNVQAEAAVGGVEIETVGSFWGTPYDVTISHDDEGALVEGMIRKSASNPSRRLGGNVWVAVLDSEGAELTRFETKAHKVNLSRHTYQARFEIEMDEMPAAAETIRVGFR